MTDKSNLGKREITCFKAYDVRGELGKNLDADVAYRIGRAFAEARRARCVVVGRDSRESSPELAAALIDGLTDGGADVLDLGLAGTEEVYFHTGFQDTDGGIEVTASHNPINYNGMKIVGRGSAPLDPATELPPIVDLATSGRFAAAKKGSVTDFSHARAEYARAMADFVDISALRPMKIVVNAGNGTAGPTFDAIASELERRGAPLTFVRMHHDVDSSFPNGIPNPLLPENQPPTVEKMKQEKADLGVAWDGDFDRCFFFDENGRFIPGEYIVGLLGAAFLEKSPGEKIVHDPRVIMNTRAMIEEAGGEAVVSKTGHAFIKRKMRDVGAIYGGEMSAHHYFRDFYYCDSGMIPWLLMIELLSRKGQTLAELLSERMRLYPSSGETNYHIDDPDAAIARLIGRYEDKADSRDDLDGVSLDFGTWRFNLRKSNTEPVVRLNLESDGDAELVREKQAELAAILKG
ncbi:MAG: phosphomannomutase [Paracoccus sp. (in: a-proteobacteria)]|uniref:phosphomannomutase n=1 Tax=unclassified Paracoccus (in: a-proteobacteria) TaxID=2688777 RepID=UPI000C5AFC08|nr:MULTISPECIES: phosphomannomutase [unclassified Paracoccus (in: a-proteobacteria)]MBA49158.1 phosphomannomutase [Paracoccus sp. (in: a-proteobacteria)]MCS5602003.1 phosphomannomutase [Paracoccus sp. (in: a-proteobacteria)]|tara:strand:- start:1486 stop:2874 length:1389 start_codon:yes stop_codon:yes gene_type:complete